MAKILGVREQIGRRDIQGAGFYESAGTVEREYSPYDAFGVVEPYDLNVPGRVAEIKSVLIALAKHRSDPLRTPAPNTQKEDLWKHINTTTEFVDAWDGPTADEYVVAMSRYKDLLHPSMPANRQSPLAQIHKMKDVNGNDVIIGGPQPTVAGLEALAQAAHRILKDSVQLDSYLQWRGGSLECSILGPSCKPPESVVLPTNIKGPDWNPRGWTAAWRNGPNATKYPNLLPMLDAIDVQLEVQWTQAPADKNEDERSMRANALVQYREQRDGIVKQLNEGVSTPRCADPSQIYDPSKGGCVNRCKSGTVWSEKQGLCVVNLSEVTGHPYKNFDECVADQIKYTDEATARSDCSDLVYASTSKYATVAIGGLVAVLGVGAYLLFRDKTVPAMPPPR